MRAFIRHGFAAIMIGLSGVAFAEWREIERFEDGMRVYADKGAPERAGTIATLEHLVRWGEPQIEPGVPPYRSTRVRMAYDCLEKREQYRGAVSYSDAFGKGIKVNVDDSAAEAWTPISAGSMEEKLWAIACAKAE